jgi:phage terminase large subunit-like protein
LTFGELIRALARCPPDEQQAVFAALSERDLRAIAEDWESQAIGGQRDPEGDWRTWLIMAGRGFGKTRTGAEWVLAQARSCAGSRIALVGASTTRSAK